MIELHERLSEFSYGYGITREIENALATIGLKTVPFLPSLIEEGKIGFDVAFNKPGVPLLIQFKLGQSLTRFVRSDKSVPAPILIRPFWRFNLNTAEPEGQYETLLKAEVDGAETYYVSPRFVDWSEYLTAFEASEVLTRSVLIKPTEIRDALVRQNLNDGSHRVVYDSYRTYVCSTPEEIAEVRASDIGIRVREQISARPEPLSKRVRSIFDGLENRSLIRRERKGPSAEAEELQSRFDLRDRHSDPQSDRHARLARMLDRARSEEDAMAAALGVEAWSLGIQMILVSSGD